MIIFDILLQRFNRSNYRYLGKYFCENYIEGSYPPEIYLEKNNIIANRKIEKWLLANGYINNLPDEKRNSTIIF
jgi:hypothetical protein